MPRLSQQILFLFQWGSEFFPQLNDLLKDPYNYSRLLPQSDHSIHRALNRLTKQHKLVKRGRRLTSSYKITRHGKSTLIELRPFLTKKEWDNKWRLIVFDIPERYRGIRQTLRNFLISVGCRSFQRSLWLTPFSVSREIRIFIKASRLSKMAFLLEVKKIYGIKASSLAEQVWQLNQLSKQYATFASNCQKAKTITKAHQKQFVKLIFSDPLLPKKLLPKDFFRSKAIISYKNLINQSK